jgi:hypothetical protein
MIDRTLPRDSLIAPGADRALAALRDPHRRTILRGLWQGWIDSETDAMVRGVDPETVETELRRTHLPMLEEEGIIEWNRETGEISKGPNFEDIEPLLELMEEHADELPPSWR